MDQYFPGEYVSRATRSTRAPGPNLRPQTVEIDAGPVWGVFRVTFIARRNPRQRMRNHWFWTMESGERIELGQPAPDAVVADVVVVHGRMLARSASRRYRPISLNRTRRAP